MSDLTDCSGTRLHLFRTGLHRSHRLGRVPLNRSDTLLDLLSRRLRLRCQFSHFFGHNRKATAMLTSPGCLDCRIQRQEVRLLGNRRDCLDDLPDLLTILAKLAHRISRGHNTLLDISHASDSRFHELTARLRRFSSLAGRSCYRTGFICHRRDIRIDCIHALLGPIDIIELLAHPHGYLTHSLRYMNRSIRRLLGIGRKFFRGCCYLLGCFCHVRDHLADIPAHDIERIRQCPDLIRRGDWQVIQRKIALGQFLGMCFQICNWLHDAAGKSQTGPDSQQKPKHR